MRENTLSVLVTKDGDERLLTLSDPNLSFTATMKAVREKLPGWRFVESF